MHRGRVLTREARGGRRRRGGGGGGGDGPNKGAGDKNFQQWKKTKPNVKRVLKFKQERPEKVKLVKN
jgi:hypothetical protein